MIISGFPRSGSSLLLLLLGGSVTNMTVQDRYESTHGGKWTKDPFAVIRVPERPMLILVRDPRDILTSRTHEKSNGEYFIGWTERGTPPYCLQRHWDAIQAQDRPQVRYEALVSDPDSVQAWMGETFGLEFSRPWGTWPWPDYTVPRYWEQSLGPIRPIEHAHSWQDRPEDQERAERLMEAHTSLRECVESLGYEP